VTHRAHRDLRQRLGQQAFAAMDAEGRRTDTILIGLVVTFWSVGILVISAFFLLQNPGTMVFCP
jgi:hypothetical protein